MPNKYIVLAKGLRPKKSLGQNFLVSEQIAEIEAAYASGRNVIEIGPGLGILTRQLCKEGKKILAVEKDTRVYNALIEMESHRNLKVLNADFFSLADEALGGFDIVVSNIPYQLSSKTLMWLSNHSMEAVLCLQKEFVEHMLAKPGTKKYSKLSVMMALTNKVTQIMRVSRSNFYPVPKVDSIIILVKPLGRSINPKISSIIGMLMEHKKKRLKNAIADSSKYLGVSKEAAARISGRISNKEDRVFKLMPEQILETAGRIERELKNMA